MIACVPVDGLAPLLLLGARSFSSALAAFVIGTYITKL